jgi:hypothetical protein
MQQKKKQSRQFKRFQRVLDGERVDVISACAGLGANGQAHADIQTPSAWVSCNTPLPLDGTLQVSFYGGSLKGFLNLNHGSLCLWLSDVVRIDVEPAAAGASREPGRIKVNGRSVWRKRKARP